MSLLLSVDYVEHERHLYFVPDVSRIPANLLLAIHKMHGVYCNSDDFKKSFYKAWDYISAAMTVNPDHLDKEDRNNQNRFAHLLVPFRIDIAETLDAGTVFAVPTQELIVIQTGSF